MHGPPAHTHCNFPADDLETIIDHYPLFSLIDSSLLDVQKQKSNLCFSTDVKQAEEEKEKKLKHSFPSRFLLGDCVGLWGCVQ